MSEQNECACIYTGAADECFNTLHHAQVVRAAKEHRCCECGDAIQRGQQHELVKLLSEGDWSRYRTCLPCVEVRDTLCCDGAYYCQLWGFVREHFRDGARVQPCIDILKTVAARTKLRDAYLEAQEGSDG